MIYFDTSATSLQKPQEVKDAVLYALDHFGNAGRSVAAPALEAGRCIYKARASVAKLMGAENPMQIAFTSGATESLNLVISALIKREDAVITTVLEHNSVLRPLYRTRCDISFIGCDDNGVLKLEELENLVKPTTKFLIANHASNVIGSIVPVKELYAFCKANDIIFILDASQTLGSIPVSHTMADIICFTGHKSLFGPQGTGGVFVREGIEIPIVKTGGSGSNSFDKAQAAIMPDIFEAGTLNSHGIAGLEAGVSYVNSIGAENIREKETKLTKALIEGLKSIPRIKIYGSESSKNRLPVVSVSLKGISNDELAVRLWEEYSIAARAGSHCAPLVHERFGTKDTGMVRFSLGYFNTEDEIEVLISALKEMAQGV